MNKIAQYLNEHILGEVTSNEHIRQRFSHDGSILCATPDIVVHPRVTNDIRKIARFSWQLAEKGHVLPLTVRGGGTDQTGAAIGKGIIINMKAHLNQTLFISLKNKNQFVHVQPGANFGSLNQTLATHGLSIPTYPSSSAYSTVGGAIANNAGGIHSGSYGMSGSSVSRLELVLANGDLIETSRINKHELSKKKGLQTFEGEIYRKIDGIIEDNQQMIIDKISNNTPDNAGYPGIAQVKRPDGSFDLTPLIIGSQGTLGIISEIVMDVQPSSSEEIAIVAAFESAEAARDAADELAAEKPAVLEYIDGAMIDAAKACGKKYIFKNDPIGAVLFIALNDANDHARNHKMKLIMKKLSKFQAAVYDNREYSDEELYIIRDISSVILASTAKSESMPPIIDGSAIPAERREEFISAVSELAAKHHITLPLRISWLDGIIHTRPTLQLHVVSDKQKAFKLINDYTELVVRFAGSIVAEAGEGRLKTIAARSQMDDDVLEVFDKIRAVFDPFGTLNPGVKQANELKTLVAMLDQTYSPANFADYAPVD